MRKDQSARNRNRSRIRDLTRRIVSLMLEEAAHPVKGRNYGYMIHELRNRALRLRGASWIETEENRG